MDSKTTYRCGDFSITDFLKEKIPVENAEELETTLDRVKTENNAIGIRGALNEEVITPLINSKYNLLDMSFLEFSDVYQVAEHKITVPRFGVINMDSSMSQTIQLLIRDMTLNREIRMDFYQKDHATIRDKLIHIMTGEEKTMFSFRDYNNSYSRTESMAKRTLKSMKEKNLISDIKSANFLLKCTPNFSLSKKEWTDILECKRYFLDTEIYMILDNSPNGWNITSLDEDKKILYSFNTEKKYDNVLLVARNEDKFYLISVFNPEYQKKGQIQNG